MKKIIIFGLAILLVGCKNINNDDSIFNSEEVIIDSSISEDNCVVDESSENQNSNVSTDEEAELIVFSKEYSIYINPSVQKHNIYATNTSNEAIEMNKIAVEMVNYLKLNTNLIINANLSNQELSKSIAESNNLQVDYHLAIHSNAGGGKGSEIWTRNSYNNYAQTILNSLNEILPYPTRGIKDGIANPLYEIKNVKATVALVEILFHDDIHQANFIIDNTKLIAEYLALGMINYLQTIDNK